MLDNGGVPAASGSSSGESPDGSARRPSHSSEVEWTGHDVEGCLACDLTAERRPLPGGMIWQSAHWRVEHCVGPLGVGTLLLKPLRHVEAIAELTVDEAAELGLVLRRTSDVVSQLCDPEQVYACLWSHAGRRPGHIHFVVQPATRELIDAHGGAYGPALQVAMFEAAQSPDEAAVERFADRARALFGQSNS